MHDHLLHPHCVLLRRDRCRRRQQGANDRPRWGGDCDGIAPNCGKGSVVNNDMAAAATQATINLITGNWEPFANTPQEVHDALDEFARGLEATCADMMAILTEWNETHRDAGEPMLPIESLTPPRARMVRDLRHQPPRVPSVAWSPLYGVRKR